MKKGLLIIVIGVLTIVSFIGCSKLDKNNGEQAKEEVAIQGQEEEQVTIVEFDRSDLDISDYNLKDEINADVNNDGTEDKIELYVHPVGSRSTVFSDKGIVKITDGKYGNALTSFECGLGGQKLSAMDVTGDKVSDINISCNDGGTIIWSETYVFDQHKYTMVDKYNWNLDKFIKSGAGKEFSFFVYDEETGQCIQSIIPEEKKESYINKTHLSMGYPLTTNNSSLHNSTVEFKDVDGDGVGEVIQKAYLSGNCNADTVMNFYIVYKYIDDNFEKMCLQEEGSPYKPFENKGKSVKDIDEAMKIVKEKMNDDSIKIQDLSDNNLLKDYIERYYCFQVNDENDLYIVRKDNGDLYRINTDLYVYPYN